MRSLIHFLSAAGLVLGLAFATAPAQSQTNPPPPTAAAIAAAKELLAMKHANGMYANAVPGVVERTKNELMQTNINYQKDLNEVAVIVTQKLAGRENEIGEGMAKVYASQFTEQELKDLVTFYKTPLGQKLLTAEPKAISLSMQYLTQWAQNFAVVVNGEFRAEMRKRGKQI
ncbi:MAG: DUF2059 domain-containing protein [Bradyrhizobium sp.]|uniref:DUF2059 domain-containing protein n=1 Tax=Bradyrhizobium sp. TaxID=376 RepID=UPI001C2A4395|nr:DUF2059 domain-containing protein [Bradyrhizobium sp.]MBU6463154.1 DUF2059 domain-containing protein [Pseudomonadota bacterium]MDE2068731.1 DUF2059 domain-containing protein [Bradyrhizobium sp.]MDE2243135.1 DUF2059 domain-containing protein [Bradyrhizobium sp.]MDE2473269.1 DUF2059 domain-containing protein [Bradyrhizobium sp.]